MAPRRSSLLLPLALSALLLAAAPAAAQNPKYISAACLARATYCGPWLAARSLGCRPRIRSRDQSPECVSAACTWCNYDVNKASASPCTNAYLAYKCGHRRRFGLDGKPPATPAPAPSTAAPSTTTKKMYTPPSGPRSPVSAAPSTTTTTATEATTTATTPADTDDNDAAPAATPSPSPKAPTFPGAAAPERAAGSCTYAGGDEVVIDLGSVSLPPGWVRETRDGFTGMVFRPEWTNGLSTPSQGGPMCFPVRVSDAGSYFLTFVSYAQHRTEHNDAWVRVREHPIVLVKTNGASNFTEPADTWLKAYHANGPAGGMSIDMWNGDHAGAHRFTIPDVAADTPFQVCLSGRSFRFSVFRIVLKKCFGQLCEGGNLWRNIIYGMPPTPCTT